MPDLGLRLHHVGYVVAEIQPISHIYVERYGYCVATEIIHDPAQTAFVQFLRLDGDPTYLEFVAPDGPASKLAKAAAKGPGLNHLCYSVDDIEKATAAMYESGMIVLSLPVPAIAFSGRRVSWLMGKDRVAVELVERGNVPGEL